MEMTVKLPTTLKVEELRKFLTGGYADKCDVYLMHKNEDQMRLVIVQPGTAGTGTIKGYRDIYVLV
jgi:hypothetical protein